MRPVVHRFLRFAVVGAIATATHIAVFSAAVEIARIEPVLANAIAFTAAVLIGYVLNRKWTFVAHDQSHARLVRYFIAALVVLGLNSAIMFAVAHVAHWSPYIGLALSIVLAPPLSFALNHYWVFRPQNVRS